MPTDTSMGRDALALLELSQALRRRGYRFTTVTPATHARVNARGGNQWADDLEGVFGWSRPFRAGLLPADLIEPMKAADVLQAEPDGWRSRVRFSTLGDRLFVHSAYPTVSADAVFFGPDSYRFVAAIDDLLERRDRPVRRAVDIGCGAGPGAVTIAGAYPEAEVLAADVNDRALAFTSVNAMAAGVSNVATVYSDLLRQVDGEFDLIVANPPYMLDPAERAYRHGGGEHGEGLSLAIVDAALDRLAAGGVLLLYTGVAVVAGRDPLRAASARRLRDCGLRWDYRELDPDVFGEELERAPYRDVDRIAVVRLLVQRPAGA